LAFALLVVAVSANVNQHLSAVGRVRGADREWHRFVKFVRQYERSYTSVREVNAKFDIFRDNMKVAAENARRNPLATFGVTQFADISQEEFRRDYLLPRDVADAWAAATKARKALLPPYKANSSAEPNDIDWVAKGVCTPVKDQAQCGSCWAFSATEALESAIKISGGQLFELAPQELVDCDKTDNGCQGGMPANAIAWLASNGGQTTEDKYPYTGQDGQCSFDASTAVATPKSSADVQGSDAGLVDALGQQPISVGVDASQWSSYTGGIMTDCGTQLDHAVLVVGYTEGQSFTVRNSWNSGWGENGYIRLATDGQKTDTCGVSDNAIIVSV